MEVTVGVSRRRPAILRKKESLPRHGVGVFCFRATIVLIDG